MVKHHDLVICSSKGGTYIAIISTASSKHIVPHPSHGRLQSTVVNATGHFTRKEQGSENINYVRPRKEYNNHSNVPLYDICTRNTVSLPALVPILVGQLVAPGSKQFTRRRLLFRHTGRFSKSFSLLISQVKRFDLGNVHAGHRLANLKSTCARAALGLVGNFFFL